MTTGQANGGSITDILGELVHEAGSDRGDIDAGDMMKTIPPSSGWPIRSSRKPIGWGHRTSIIEPYRSAKKRPYAFVWTAPALPTWGFPLSTGERSFRASKSWPTWTSLIGANRRNGKIRYKLAKDREIELRIATLPTAGGNEDVVMRLLTANDPIPLEAMDLSSEVSSTIKKLAEKPHGIMLCVGPTGSGKTTTLHAVLRHINTDGRKILTAEDPIEITQEGLRQVQVQPKIGFTFAAAMRAFLRADPDVIMIGEMRDKETADTAIEASLRAISS